MDELELIINSIGTVICVSEIDGDKILFANQDFALEVDLDVSKLKGVSCTKALERCGKSDIRKRSLENLLDCDGNVVNRKYVWEFYHLEKQRWYLIKDSIIKWNDGRDVHLQVAEEITSQKQQEEQLEYAAIMDRMTGTYNREWARGLIQEILDDEEEKQINSLVFIDVDGLKTVNDELGHMMGDQLIMLMVNLIKEYTRRSDVLCRWGGDEFVMIVRADMETTTQVFEKVGFYVKKHNETTKDKFNVSFSYGIVEISRKYYSSVEEVIAEADKLMYMDKKRNRNKIN